MTGYLKIIAAKASGESSTGEDFLAALPIRWETFRSPRPEASHRAIEETLRFNNFYPEALGTSFALSLS